MKITIIVPCYNEELVIEILYKRLINVLSNYNDIDAINKLYEEAKELLKLMGMPFKN